MKIQLAHLKKHETKRKTLRRFLLVLAIFFIYIIFLVYKFGSDGLVIGIITWSAFVLATPLPDAGLILDFPIRVVTGIKMIYSEIVVWVVAITINAYFFFNNPEYYNSTVVTRAFYQILSTPWPDWIIIALSAGGTFLSLYFGDELLDIAFKKDRVKYLKHKKWYRLVAVAFGVLLLLFLYKNFLHLFGVEI